MHGIKLQPLPGSIQWNPRATLPHTYSVYTMRKCNNTVDVRHFLLSSSHPHLLEHCNCSESTNGRVYRLKSPADNYCRRTRGMFGRGDAGPYDSQEVEETAQGNEQRQRNMEK
uniref:Uncharacterized protein n=1 Tax=Sipha flava TaxID=143950 RepID=A0A2S2QK77_9HEMI